MSGLRRVGDQCELGKQCLLLPSPEMPDEVKLCWRAAIASGMSNEVVLNPPCPLPDIDDEPASDTMITRSNGVDFADTDRRQHQIVAPPPPEDIRIVGEQDADARNLGADS